MPGALSRRRPPASISRWCAGPSATSRSWHLDYRDELGRATERTIRPIALIYYSETANIVAWCELRQAIRNFRSDRVEALRGGGRLLQGRRRPAAGVNG